VQLSVFKNDQKVVDIDLAKDLHLAEQGPINFFLGRAKDCHVQIDDKAISRYLAKITFEKGVWSIEKNSEDGLLLINGEVLIKRQIKNGDTLTVAGYTISIFMKEQPVTLKASEAEAVIEETFDVALESAAPDNISAEIENAPTVTSYISTDEALGDEPANMDDVAPAPMSAEDLAMPEVDDNPPIEEEASLDGATQVFKSFVQVYLEIFGEHAPFDKYNLETSEVFIGRDPTKCQIVLKDSEVSGTHAVIKKNNITCSIEDLNSANGTLVNGVRVNKADLTNGDEILIGTTTLTVKVKSDFLQEEQETLMAVEENQEIEVEEEVGVEDTSVNAQNTFSDLNSTLEMPSDKPKSLVDKWKALNKRQKLIYGGVGLVVLYVLMDSGDDATAPEKKNKKPAQKIEKVAATSLKLSKEELEFVEGNYLLGRKLVEEGKYAAALNELDKILKITKGEDYKSTKQTIELAKDGLRKIEEIEKKRQDEIERRQRMEKVKELVVRAKEAVKERQYDASDALFNKILELDPENFDVPQLRIELDAWKKEQDRIALEKATAEADRKRKMDQFQPAKNIYLQKKWYLAISKLEEFLKIKNMDEDLIKEASTMLTDSKDKLSEVESPLLGKARSLKEGQDLKGAYEQYGKVLSYNPTNLEALNEMTEIKDILHTRAKKLYREAIISESLSLFQDAKEKLQEVQQISPLESEYYKKATDKLNDYLE